MSHIARLYVDAALQEGVEIGLPDAQSKYLLRVMRLADGARVRVFNGEDGEWACVLAVRGKLAVLLPSDQIRDQAFG
ncbi:MAG: RNA methyltransferase PUA domain-containing protein, partial [Pseudomonadota bacterium]